MKNPRQYDQLHKIKTVLAVSGEFENISEFQTSIPNLENNAIWLKQLNGAMHLMANSEEWIVHKVVSAELFNKITASYPHSSLSHVPFYTTIDVGTLTQEQTDELGSLINENIASDCFCEIISEHELEVEADLDVCINDDECPHHAAKVIGDKIKQLADEDALTQSSNKVLDCTLSLFQ